MSTGWQFEVNVYDLANDPRIETGSWWPNGTSARDTHQEWNEYIAAWTDRLRSSAVWCHAHRPSPSQVHGGHVRLDEVVEEMADVSYGDVAHLQACIDAIYDWGDYSHRLFLNAVFAPAESAAS